MPRKNIYIRDEDVTLFAKAEELGQENLSVTIADALRRYVATREMEAQGYEEHTLEVGRWGDHEDYRTIRVIGRLLASDNLTHGQTQSADDRGTKINIYQTKSGKIVIWWEHWSRWQGESTRADLVTLDSLPDYDVELTGKAYGFELRNVPGNLLQEAADNLGKEIIETID